MITYNGIIMAMDGIWVGPKIDPYNPLDLPPNTVRVRTSDGNPPIKDPRATYETATLVSGTTDVYDVYKSGTIFRHLLSDSKNVTEVLGANTSNITEMDLMFYGCDSLITVALFDTSNVTEMSAMFLNCTSLTTVPLFNTSNATEMDSMFGGTALTTVPLFDTSNVTRMAYMFSNCPYLTTVPLFDTSNVTDMAAMFLVCDSLTTVPLFNTSKVTRMNTMFAGCTKVETGALALYQQASTQTNPPSNHIQTFSQCGIYTTTGAAELAQIPSDWK